MMSGLNYMDPLWVTSKVSWLGNWTKRSIIGKQESNRANLQTMGTYAPESKIQRDERGCEK